MTNDQVPMTNHSWHRLVIRLWSVVILCVGIVLLCGSSRTLLAEDTAAAPKQLRLLERDPFDLVILNKAAGGARLEVLPLSLPQRPLTNVPKEGAFKVRLLDHPSEDFSVAWRDVAQVRVFEEVLF